MQLSNYREVGSDGAYPQWLRNLKNTTGVYVIRCKQTRKTLYVGYSSSGRLYGTLTRHFQSVGGWFNPTGQQKPTYPRSSVEVAVMKLNNSRDASIWEQHYICELDPRDNTYNRDQCDEVPF